MSFGFWERKLGVYKDGNRVKTVKTLRSLGNMILLLFANIAFKMSQNLCSFFLNFRLPSSRLFQSFFQDFALDPTKMYGCNPKIGSYIMLRNSFDNFRFLPDKVQVSLLW